ncbi:glycoside hydrolase family 2 protein [Blastococcus haudaquaticus]|uniref:Glycosyl hydrolases family 2, TIM barrel domain n=1 Tax=Blastococcus haudaquaticus TaxID=1938745 RepID=A0A286H4Q0_9ACTN|nr:glycoside hydrolase family 2 TIM barrel-domain containing protein [Blastococcus haudaquaticus]SOE02264.1 Glycosyl hydrolases family 2, TIM barrel domain [Blastococcus haudaquaticus]
MLQVRAFEQDGTYPRPQLMRDAWTDLTGTWQFAYDDEREGLLHRWHQHSDLHDRTVFDRDIVVPFPPESPASGIGDTGFHPVLWYRRSLRLADIAAKAALRRPGHRLFLRLGAVDYRAQVWLDGVLVASHTGGQTPWHADLTDQIDPGDMDADHVLVIRAEDDPHDITQPRGKQDWQEAPHDIWYHRTSGIWQPVWCEVLPPLAVEHLAWSPDLPGARVHLGLTLTSVPREPVTVVVRLSLDDAPLATQRVRVSEQRSEVTIVVPALANGEARQRLVWSPENPRLVDAHVRVLHGSGDGGDEAGPEVLDEVSSYLGLRSAGVGNGAFLLNARPYHLLAVLSQGYWPGSHLAAPDAAALRHEVEMIKTLGFNAVRMHQKAEDPRFLHWADRLGLLVWGETANAYAFSPEAVRRLTSEWLDLVHRDVSHPSIVTWVPINESWGVPDIVTDTGQQDFVAGLTALTRAVDPSRPVISNDGFEHVDSDVWGVHDYADDGAGLLVRFGSAHAFADLLAGFNQQGRRVHARHGVVRGQPVILSEFGGLRFCPDGAPAGAEDVWGYSTVDDPEEYLARLADWFGAIRAAPVLAGSCYTQLTDTLQEANGLLDEYRTPKVAAHRLRAVITGRSTGGASHETYRVEVAETLERDKRDFMEFPGA